MAGRASSLLSSLPLCLPSSLPSRLSVLLAADLLDFFPGEAKTPVAKQVTRQVVSNNRVVEGEANFMIVHLYRALQLQGIHSTEHRATIVKVDDAGIRSQDLAL